MNAYCRNKQRDMNLSKILPLVGTQIGTLVFLLVLSFPTQAQDYEFSGYQMQAPFVNEFMASPDGKNLLYNVVTHNTVDFRSKFFIQNLEDGGDDTPLGSFDAHIHSWLDNEHVILMKGATQEFIIQNIFTQATEMIKSPAPAHYEPLLISKDLCIFSDLGYDKTTYYFYKNGALDKTVDVGRGFAHTVYDVRTNTILEVSQSAEGLNIYQYSHIKDQRSKLASIPFGKDRVIHDVTLLGNKIYYLEDYQHWNEYDEHEWKESMMKLSSYDMNTESKRILHSFNKGVECLNMEIVSPDKYLVVLKDHKESQDVTAQRNMESGNSKELSAMSFAKITDQFKGSISAKTMINAVMKVDADYPSVYVKGSSIALALSGLPKETKEIIKTKVDKLVISNGNITVKLKEGVSYIKLASKTKKGNNYTVKINQGTTINLTEVNSDKVYAKMKGIAVWMAVKYASIGAVAIKGEQNTLSVFTSMGVGFWTSHKLGSINRRIE